MGVVFASFCIHCKTQKSYIQICNIKKNLKKNVIKAYDSVSRKSVVKTLKEFGIDEVTREIIKDYCNRYYFKINSMAETMEWF